MRIGIAQKDGRPSATLGVAPPLLKDGLPAVVAIPAGSFIMGADAAPLSGSITKGFGVMSNRPEHGDFDELSAHKVRLSKAFRMSVTQVSPAEYRLFDPAYVAGQATPAYAAGVSWQQATAYCAWRRTRLPAHWAPLSGPITESWSEGPSVLQVGSAWIVYYDHYRAPRARYEGVETSDWIHWTSVNDKMHFPDYAKHGSFFHVSDAEAAKLLSRHDPPTLAVPVAAK